MTTEAQLKAKLKELSKMNNKINLDGKDYDLDTMSDEQKYLVSLIQEQQLKIKFLKKILM